MPVTYRIHPAIGIARVGDSPDDFFIGPEAPGVAPVLKKLDDSTAQPGTYKDQQHRIKRQGARFRIYEYTEDTAGVVTKVREITGAEAQIEWEVHLVNRKAAAPKFNSTGRRNAGKPEGDLIIDPGPQRISGANQAMKKLHGTFMQTMDVQLGDLLTDAAGRLIVLGGHGKSQALPQSPLEDFADNDGWCDDVADGPVRATLRLHGSATPLAADPAWMIVAPPDFAPPIENVVTLYDAVYNVMARFDPRLAVSDATSVSFTKDIYPILRRVSHLHWVSMVAGGGHGEDSGRHFISRVNELSSNKSQDAGARVGIFQALRKPQGGGGRMPKLPPLAVQKAPGAALTEAQYKRMDLWAQGKFDADWPGAEPVPTPLDKLPEQDRPQALDRAALEACVGGPFFPGIEASRDMLNETTYDNKRPFRINANLPPGTLTAKMAVPWQADFHDCSIELGADWWPGQRPNRGAVARSTMLSGCRRIGKGGSAWSIIGRNSVSSWRRQSGTKWSMSKMNASLDHHIVWPECDVVVLGGGPAGAAAAITLACAGRSVVVIEKSHYEQPRIGETLPPAARLSLAGLKVWEPFLAAGHLPSPGVLSVWGEYELYETHFIFNPYGQGWHLDRQRFDTMLAHAARQAGARLCCGAQVTSCLPLAGERWQVGFTSGVTSSARQHQLRTTFLIDATGRAAVLARWQGAKRLNTDRLVGLAGVLAARARESDCPENACDTCTLVEACADGWWYSALLPRMRLIAVYMTDADLLPRHRGLWRAFWHARLQQTTHTRARLHACDLQAVPRVVAANSSRLDSVSGHGWLAVGDAAMAFDPLSSQGLMHALASGMRAGEALHSCLAGEAAAMGEYDRKANEVFRAYSRLRAVYYGREQRWSQSVFWRRRHDVAA